MGKESKKKSKSTGSSGAQTGTTSGALLSMPPKPTGPAPMPPSTISSTSMPPKPIGPAPMPPSTTPGTQTSPPSQSPKSSGTTSLVTAPTAAKYPILNQIQKHKDLSKLYRISLLALRYQNAPQSEPKGKGKGEKVVDFVDKYGTEDYPTVDTAETTMGLSSGITDLARPSDPSAPKPTALDGGGMESKGVEVTAFIGSLIGCAKNVYGAVKGVIGFVKNKKKDELDYGSSRNDGLGFLENCIGAISTGWSTTLSIIKMAGGVLGRGIPLVGSILGVISSAFSLALKIKKYIETTRLYKKLSQRLKKPGGRKKKVSGGGMDTTVDTRDQLLTEQQYTLKKRFTRLTTELVLDSGNIITDLVGIFPGFGTITSVVGSGVATLTKIGMLAARKIKEKAYKNRTKAKGEVRSNAAAFMLGELSKFANTLMGYNKDEPLTDPEATKIAGEGNLVKEDIQGTGAKLKSLLLISSKDELAEKLSSAMSTGG